MKVIEAGIVKRIEFPNRTARKRYLDNLRIDGKAYYVISEGAIGNSAGEIVPFITIVEPWRNAHLKKNITID